MRDPQATQAMRSGLARTYRQMMHTMPLAANTLESAAEGMESKVRRMDRRIQAGEQ